MIAAGGSVNHVLIAVVDILHIIINHTRSGILVIHLLLLERLAAAAVNHANVAA